VPAWFARELERELAAANAKVTELETANTKIKTLESKAIEQEDEINDLYYQQAYREEMN
jgi:hypothetical protein